MAKDLVAISARKDGEARDVRRVLHIRREQGFLKYPSPSKETGWHEVSQYIRDREVTTRCLPQIAVAAGHASRTSAFFPAANETRRLHDEDRWGGRCSRRAPFNEQVPYSLPLLQAFLFTVIPDLD